MNQVLVNDEFANVSLNAIRDREWLFLGSR